MVDDTTPRRRWRQHSGASTPEVAICTAVQTLLSTRPLHEISVEDILGESGVSRAAFYYYFSSKFDVVAYLAASALDGILTELGAWASEQNNSPQDVLRRSLRSGVESWLVHGPLFAGIIENMDTAPQVRAVWIDSLDRFTATVAREIERERLAGVAPDGPPADAVAGALIWGSERLLYLGVRGSEGLKLDVESVGDALQDLWYAAIYGSGRTETRR